MSIKKQFWDGPSLDYVMVQIKWMSMADVQMKYLQAIIQQHSML